MDLQAKLPDPRQTVLLYGTTPPRLGTAPDAVAAAAEKAAARLGGLPLDGVVVYDIQDETGRTNQPRPFPFVGTIDPREYAKHFRLPAIVYKALGRIDEAQWRAWLAESKGQVQFLSIVGRPASATPYPLPLSRAIRIAADSGSFVVGGVVIAERH